MTKSRKLERGGEMWGIHEGRAKTLVTSQRLETNTLLEAFFFKVLSFIV